MRMVMELVRHRSKLPLALSDIKADPLSCKSPGLDRRHASYQTLPTTPPSHSHLMPQGH
jgi:hypothetical protein